jgi:WD40 repeat protein
MSLTPREFLADVTAVYTGGGVNGAFGSGRLIAPGLVMTAGHVVDYPSREAPARTGWKVCLLRERKTDGSWTVRHEAELLWRGPGELDLAFLRLVSDTHLTPVLTPKFVSYNLVGMIADVDAAGFPEAWLGPASEYTARGSLRITTQRGPYTWSVSPTDKPDDPRGWKGMSGAAVCHVGPDDRLYLLGVVQEVPARFSGLLQVARLSEGFADRDFYEHLRTAIGEEPCLVPWTESFLSEPSHGQCQHKRTPMMAPEPSAEFVARPRELEELKRALLDEQGDARGGAIKAALVGAGGYGKTTLAKALAHDPDVQGAFSDGVLWVELGVQPSNIVGTVMDLIEHITGERPLFEKIHAATAALGETLGDRRFLLVIDDAWHPADLQPFLHGGSRTTRLVTTRVHRVVPDDAFRLTVDAMQKVEAIQLLESGLPRSQNPSSWMSFAKLADRLGEWALLLKLANGFLRERVRYGELIAAAIVNINRRLDAKGLTAFDPHNEMDRTRAVARTIEVSLDLLDKAGRLRFAELAVFHEEVDVPIDVAATLWARTASVSQVDSEDHLAVLARLSLLHSLDLHQRTFRVHGTMRYYLLHSMETQTLTELNDQMAAALDEAKSSERTDAVALYDYRFRPYHLAEALNRVALNKLLTDPEWIEGKVKATRGALELIKDYSLFASPDQPLHELIGRTLTLTSSILARDVRQVLPQLHGRLIGGATSKDGAEFLDCILKRIPKETLIETRRALKPPWPEEVGSLERHSLWVDALAVLPDGRLASGSRDATIRLWDPTTGKETARLADHWVNALAILHDGRLASGSEDNAIRLWNPVTGRQTARLIGHELGVTALTVRSHKELISGSDDQTIRIWDTATGRETARLEAYGHGVTALAVLRDGRLVSGSTDTTIRLWDLITCRETARFNGHKHWVTALAVMPDGRLASGSHDHTIRLWDVGTGCETACFAGHTSWVRALAILPDGRRLASGSFDATIRLWDVASGREITRLEVDGTPVAFAVLRDGRIAVGDSLGRIHWLAIKGEGVEKFFSNSK